MSGSLSRHLRIDGTMVDSGAKYPPEAESYDRFTYEARNLPYAPVAAEELAGVIVARLKRMPGR